MHVVEAVGMSVYFVLLASWCAGDSKFSQTLFGQWICRSQQELLQYKDEKPELLEYLDATSLVSDKHAVQTIGFNSKTSTPIDGSTGRRARREQLFISHKLSNVEQSTDIVTVKRRVMAAIVKLGVGYLDMVSICSPLTDKEHRLASYQALLERRDAGFVRSVGVCNYGVPPLQKIAELVGGDNLARLPAINQLELSPSNTHSDVVQYCDRNGVAVGCVA